MMLFFFFKQKTAYELRISDWSSDVCSSDLVDHRRQRAVEQRGVAPEPRPGGGSPLRGIEGAGGDQERDVLVAHRPPSVLGAGQGGVEIGSASCRERVCQYV